MTTTMWVEVGVGGLVLLLVGVAIGVASARRQTRARLATIRERLANVADEVARARPAPTLVGLAGLTEPSGLPESSRVTEPTAGTGDQTVSDRLESLLDRLEEMAGAAVDAVGTATAEVARLRSALDALPEGIVIRDEEGAIRFRNAIATGLLDSRHADLLAARAVEEQLSQATGNSPSERVVELYGPPRRTLMVRTAPLDDERRPLGVVAVLEDVSERRRLDAVRRDFVANVSHELKTPVAALGLLAETLLAEQDPAVAARLAGRVQVEALRVGRIIDDLLDLSRIEAEETPPREPVVVSLVLAEAVERVRSLAEQRGIGLELTEPEDTLAILGDRRQLVSALYNLVENAVKYSDPDAPVRVRVRREGASVVIEVSDDGVGIPARDLERIFERFYRVDQGRSRSTGGTGLGLAIVRHVAANHGGEVTVSSREGEGSTFTLRLPAMETVG